MVIDEAPVLVNDLDGNDSLRSRQRNGRADRHVLGDARGGSAQGHQFFRNQTVPGFGRGCHDSRGVRGGVDRAISDSGRPLPARTTGPFETPLPGRS